MVLQYTRDEMTGLWRAPLQILDRTTHQSNNIHQVISKENSIKYLHEVAFIPVQDTWTKSVNRGCFNTWPGITEKTSTIRLMLMPQSRATSHRSSIIHDQQQSTRILEKSMRSHIQAKNKITAKQRSLWLQWTRTTSYTQTRQENYL